MRKLAVQGKGDLASSTIRSDGIDLPVAFDGTTGMSVRKPNGAMYPKGDGTEAFLNLEGISIDEAILRLAPLVTLYGKKVRILGDGQFLPSLMKRLTDGGMTAAEDITMEPGTGEVVRTTAKVTGAVTIEHSRALAFMLLKGLLYLGFSPRDVGQLMNYVEGNPTSGIIVRPIGNVTNTEQTFTQEDFTHEIHWQAVGNRIIGVVLPFRSKWVTIGFGFVIFVPQPVMSPPSIFPSKGILVAVYDPLTEGIPPGVGQAYIIRQR